MERFGWRIAAAFALLAVITAVGIGALTHRRPDSVSPEEDGGVKDNTDPDAPKSITSREITAFYTNFHCDDPLDTSRSGSYRFKIEENYFGELMLSVSGAMNGSVKVEKPLLGEVQGIVEQHELEKLNGIYRAARALPPEYGPCSLSADYASGERLFFQIDGDHDESWCGDLRKLFFRVFAEAGYTEFLPPPEAITVAGCTIAFGTGDLSYDYGFITDTDGERRFYRSVYDMAEGEILEEKLIEPDDALLEGLQKAIEESGLGALAVDRAEYDPAAEHRSGEFVDIYIDYENGRQLSLQAEGEDIPDEWFSVRERLQEYLDSLFEIQSKPEE